MNRKDLDLLCRTLKRTKPGPRAETDKAKYGQWITMVLTLSAEIDAASANFERAKFLDRCGVEA